MTRAAFGALIAIAMTAGAGVAAPADTLEFKPLVDTDRMEAERAGGPMTEVETPSAEVATSEAAPVPEAVSDPDLADLRERRLLLPVEGVRASDLHDGFRQSRGRRIHHAIDIMAPRNTPIHAVEDGIIARLDPRGGAGGITVYQLDPSGEFGYYYAHLERWADGLMEGDFVTRGQIIGYVGTTGNAPERSPHLHFAIHRLGPENRPWVGSPLNPYLVFLP